MKAQEDAELLKSVVSPLEEEISNLKAQLDEARGAALRASVRLVVHCLDSIVIFTLCLIDMFCFVMFECEIT